MNGANTKVANMNELQLRLREARKTCSADGFNGKFCQVFNDAIDHISTIEQKRDALLEDIKLAAEEIDVGDAHWAYIRLKRAVAKAQEDCNGS